ncbi:hypothetical protein ACQ4M3_39580 [Leptolyngbya sp. AN03gr2]|uniref:hypothetical protein n=1 Tax=unclassified Leptolyngbya TaxID=2650499 RepID=UPI003D31839A
MKANKMSAYFRWSSIGAIAGIFFGSAAIAVPIPDRNGDYTRSNAIGHLGWRVIDPDENGLNCRMAKRFQHTDYASANAPDALYDNFVHNIGEWSVVARFATGEMLQAQTAHVKNPNFLIDRQGKAWMAVLPQRGQSSMCFVRSNRRFIRPF